MENFEVNRRAGRKGFSLEHCKTVLEQIIANELAYSEIGRQMVPPCSVQHIYELRKRVRAINTWAKVTKSKDLIARSTKETPEFVSMVAGVLGIELIDAGESE